MIASPKRLSRRDFLKLAGTASGALLLAGCTPVSTATTPVSAAFLPTRTSDVLKTSHLVIPKTMGVNAQFLGDRTDTGEIEAFIDGGFGFLRVDLTWETVERTPGEYDFKKYLHYITQFTEIGICSILIIDYGNPLYDGGRPPISETARLGFARYLDAAAQAFNGQMVIWEIWNEPDQKGFWPNPDPVQYNRLLRLALKTLRNIDPQTRIVAPAISNLKDAKAIQFIEELGRSEIIQQLDGISVHPYRYPSPEESRPDFLHIRRLVDAYSPNKVIPILWGESGYNERDVGEETQAALAIRQYLFSLTLDAPYTNWYNWRDYESSSQSGAFYGMLRATLQPRLTYHASRALAKNLNGYEFLRRLPVEDESNYVLLFYKNGRGALAAWTTGLAHSIHLDPIYASPKISGLLGERKPEDELTYPDVFISSSPLFLKFDIPDDGPPSIIWKPLGSVQSLNLEKPEISLWILNTTDKPLQIGLKIQSEWVQMTISLETKPGDTQYNIPVKMIHTLPAPSAAIIEISYPPETSTERALIWLSPFAAKESTSSMNAPRFLPG